MFNDNYFLTQKYLKSCVTQVDVKLYQLYEEAINVFLKIELNDNC